MFLLRGDRLYGNDNALTGGLGYFGEHKVLLLGIDKEKILVIEC